MTIGARGQTLPAAKPAGIPVVITVQYLRALAAGLVVLHHALNVPALAPYYTKPFGTFGVDLFFVISGYIMWATTCGRERGPAKFWRARIARVVPLYWIFTSLFVVVALAVPGAMLTAAIEPAHLLKSYLFIPAEHPRLGGILPTYTLGWTLNYEMFFYFVFGLCLLISHRASRLMLLVGSLTLLVVIGAIGEPRGAIARTYTNPILLEFAAGSVLAWFATSGKGLSPAVGWGLIGAAVVWLAVAYAHDASTFEAHAFPAVAMVAGALVLEPLARERISASSLFLGNASYSIYLAHPFGVRAWYLAFERLIGTASFAAAAAYVLTAVVVGFGAGVASYLFVEKPLIQLTRRRAGRSQRATTAAA